MQGIHSSKIIRGLALAGALLLVGVVGFAQQPTTQGQGTGGNGQWHSGFDGGPFAKLNLTDAQKQQMQQIAARYQQTFQAARQQERSQRGSGGNFNLFNGGAFDEAAVRAAAQARANAEVEMEVAHAHMMYDMYNVLTPDQKAQFAALQQQREQKRQQFRANRKNSAGQNQ
jgi:protein CpxP